MTVIFSGSCTVTLAWSSGCPYFPYARIFLWRGENGSLRAAQMMTLEREGNVGGKKSKCANAPLSVLKDLGISRDYFSIVQADR